MTFQPWKRLAAVAVAAALSIAPLAACSSGSGTEAAGGDDKSISVWFPGTDETEMKLVNDTIVPEFEKETGAEVEVTFVNWEEISPKLNAAFAAGTAPDVFGHGIAAAADFVHNDRIEDLTPYVDKLDPAEVEDLGNALPGGEVKGKQYVMPLLMTIRLLAYSAKDYEDAGLDPESPPKTWQDVRTAAEKLTERKGDKISRSGMVVPSNPISTQQTFATLLWSNGGAFLSDDQTAATFNSPEGVQALQYFTDLYQGDKAVDGMLGSDWGSLPPAQQPIVNGKASMQLTSVSSVADLKKAGPDRDIRVMMPPSFEGKEPASFGGPANGLMINKDSENKDLAWKFVEYMTSQKTNEEYSEGLGNLPIHKSTADADFIKDSPELTLALEALQYAHGNPNVPGWVQMRDGMDKSLEQSLHGKQTPQEALKAASAEVDKVLAANK